ncbi:hypothetical protein E1161_09055 [Saccharopolyspora aridisoli]|uniref:Maltokinase N-terminal cap domain-containing protein n=1 Tax=Saccharopolyspora aridisoli TaxID=2530385 RepID=A0A4R4UPK2_9PSEU|nr:hypothetical protein [Saccharopolyspora aridisoli]TDC94137.1 hypothetical protein E1161_09055 [Saccharopolyspora aridisoli]
MAIVHRATVSPTKQEIVTSWLDAQSWGAEGRVEMLGSYRFDDPAGEVGVESLVVRRGGTHFQLPLTYRGAPMDDAGARLLTTMEHSALGRRWIYLATSDPVGFDCFVRALLGQLEQADMEVWEGAEFIARRGTGVRVTITSGPGLDGHDMPAATATVDTVRLTIPHVLDANPGGERQLAAQWDGGSPVVVASLTSRAAATT